MRKIEPSPTKRTLTPETIEEISVFSPEETLKLVQELQVHQLELETQNKELRVAQVNLQKAWEKYVDLYNFAPVGYFTLNKKGVVKEANLTGVSMLGLERAYVIEKPFSTFVPRDDSIILEHYLQNLLEKNQEQSLELQMVKNENSLFDAHFAAVSYTDIEANETRIRIIMGDVTVERLTDKKKSKSKNVIGTDV